MPRSATASRLPGPLSHSGSSWTRCVAGAHVRTRAWSGTPAGTLGTGRSSPRAERPGTEHSVTVAPAMNATSQDLPPFGKAPAVTAPSMAVRQQPQMQGPSRSPTQGARPAPRQSVLSTRLAPRRGSSPHRSVGVPHRARSPRPPATGTDLCRPSDRSNRRPGEPMRLQHWGVAGLASAREVTR